MSGWQSATVHINGLNLHYTRTGGAKPPLVLVHGFSDDGSCWTPVAERLADDYDVIMPDARGHGFSDGPEQGYAMAQQADDLIKLLAALGIYKPVILGHSMGALTAMVVAETQPELPRAILLEDPPAWWYAGGFGKPMTPEQLASMRQEFIERKQQPRDVLIAAQRQSTPAWSDGELGPWADSKIRLNPAIVEIFEPAFSTSLNWPEGLKRVGCPALLITADVAKWAIVSAEGAAALQTIIPQLEVAHIPNAGHCIHRDQMDMYMDVICSFLSRIPT